MTEYVQRKYTGIICNRCNIYNAPYNERLVKIKLKSLEYRQYEFYLITFFLNNKWCP